MLTLSAILGLSLFGTTWAQDDVYDKARANKEAAKAAKAAKVKFRWGKNLKQAQKQAEETGLPIVLLFTGTNWCGYCQALEREVLSKKDFRQGMNGVAIGVKIEFGSANAISGSKEAKKYNVGGVPSMVVIDAQGNFLGKAGYMRGKAPNYYVDFFKQYAPKSVSE